MDTMDVTKHAHHSQEEHEHHMEYLVSAPWVLSLYYIWAGVLCVAAFVALAGLFKPENSKSTVKRAGFYLSFAINFVAAMAYFAMAHKQGRAFVIEDGSAYEVYWARYADWSITTPLLLTHLIIFAGLAWQQWVFVLLLDIGMIVTGLIGNLLPDNTKWAWWAFGCIFQIIIAIELFGNARKNAYAKGNKQGQVYMAALTFLMLVWVPYPFVWAADIGFHWITPSTAGVIYAILDFIAKPVYTAVLFSLHVHLDNSGASLEEAAGEAREALLEGDN